MEVKILAFEFAHCYQKQNCTYFVDLSKPIHVLALDTKTKYLINLMNFKTL